MKIVCPACDAAYDVPASVLAAPRKMRCARCAHDWVPSAVPSAAPAPEPRPVPEPPAVVSPAFVAEPEPPDSAPEPEAIVVVPAPAPDLEPLVFTPAGFTSFETLPPVIDPLEDTGFEPVKLRPSAPPTPLSPVLQAVPPRTPGEASMTPASAASEQAGPGLATLLAAWAASLAILFGLGWAGVHWRTEVVRAWPPSERLYVALGLDNAPS